MELAKFWRSFLAKWPANLEHRGVVVACGEQVSFVEFYVSDQAALFERLAPDSVGGRKLILPYQKIDTIKITESVDSSVFVASGFLPVASTHSVM